ncbi:MAG: hypothetical protein KGQ49_05870 [Verrucomicrobia bacterium]|nr:hypothetical protein [Verrucomicrobiota bacterium]MBU6446906.1 hypothetical protein [Verrucomicrobiota bacterium]MDE3047407.1 hypothetical protein [Verrucomicrobiota bacterium]
MEEQIEARATPAEVWKLWQRAHPIESGQKGKDKFRYQILDVKEGEAFSIVWKSLFVRLVFTHKVQPTEKGSMISYHVQIKGPFAWAVRRLIGNKIRNNLQLVLKAIVKELEYQSVK